MSGEGHMLHFFFFLNSIRCYFRTANRDSGEQLEWKKGMAYVAQPVPKTTTAIPMLLLYSFFVICVLYIANLCVLLRVFSDEQYEFIYF